MVYNIVLTYISFHFQFNTTKIQWVVVQKRLLLSKYTIWGRFFPQETLLLHYQTTKIIKSLKNHFKPDVNFSFPEKLLHNCNRSCKTDYLTHVFVYSSSKAVFCVYCTLFPDTQGKLRSSFMDKGYSQ